METQETDQASDDTLYYEKLELVFAEYERSLDLDVALDLVPLSESDRERLESDELLAARIAVCDARQRASLVDKLKDLIDNAESESVQLSALKEFGRTFYPKRFKEDTGFQPGVQSQQRVIRYELVEPSDE